jgi:spore germination protein GerM
MDKELIILAIYINVSNLSSLYAEQIMQSIVKQYETMYDNVNKDVKVYWFPSNETKVECIYPPVKLENEKAENELLKIYKLLLSSQPEEAREMVSNIEKKLKLNSLVKKIKNN